MDGADDSLALVSHALQYLDDVFCHERVKTGSGLIAEQQRRVGQELNTVNN